VLAAAGTIGFGEAVIVGDIMGWRDQIKDSTEAPKLVVNRCNARLSRACPR